MLSEIATIALRFQGFGYNELLDMSSSDRQWWYTTTVELNEREEEAARNMGK